MVTEVEKKESKILVNEEVKKAGKRKEKREKERQKELEVLLNARNIITHSQKKALAKKLFWHRCRVDPLFWLEHRFGEDPRAFKWSLFDKEYSVYKGHAWDGDINPLAKAWQKVADWEYAALESATGTGKTFFLARVVLWFLDCFEDSLVATFAPTARQLEVGLWKEISQIFHKFKKIRPHAWLSKKLKLVVDSRSHDEHQEDGGEGNKEGWMALGYPTKVKSGEQSATSSQGIHREHMLLITEETPGIPTAVITALEETCTADHNLILAVGNPDSELDGLHTFASHSYVNAFRISGEDHPNVVSGKTLIPGAVTRRKLAERREKNGANSAIYLSRGRGIAPTQGKESLIRLSWIKEAAVYTTEGLELDKKSHNALGMDVSDSDDGDKTSLAYGKNNLLTDLIAFHCDDPIDLCYNLIYDEKQLGVYEKREDREIRRFKIPTIQSKKINPSSVGVDTVGIGRAHYHTLKKRKVKVIPLEGGVLKKALEDEHFVSLRDQMWWELRQDLRQGNIKIFVKDTALFNDLCRQLTAPKFWINNKSIRVEPKRDVKKRLGLSPDLGDSVAYWNWMRKGHYRKSTVVIGTY